MTGASHIVVITQNWRPMATYYLSLSRIIISFYLEVALVSSGWTGWSLPWLVRCRGFVQVWLRFEVEKTGLRVGCLFVLNVNFQLAIVDFVSLLQYCKLKVKFRNPPVAILYYYVAWLDPYHSVCQLIQHCQITLKIILSVWWWAFAMIQTLDNIAWSFLAVPDDI